jgi:hypothetical protein
MNFTIFLNSRGRVNQLARCLNAIEAKTKNPAKLEVIVKVDTDDSESIGFLRSVEKTDKQPGMYPFELKILVSPRPASLCASFNQMAKMGKGQYLFVFTDDAEIMTNGWDEIALSKINTYKKARNIEDDIIYGCTADTSIDKVQGEKYASFPIISKQATEALGFFMYDSFVGLGGDSSIYRVYHGADRVVDMPEIQLDHINNNTLFKVMSPDLTGFEMRMRTQQTPQDPFKFDVAKEVLRLKSYIETYAISKKKGK